MPITYNEDLNIFYRNESFFCYNTIPNILSNFIYELVRDNPYFNLIDDVITKNIITKENVKSYVLTKLNEYSSSNTYFRFYFKFNDFILRLRNLNEENNFDNTHYNKLIYYYLELSLYNTINNDFMCLNNFRLFSDYNINFDSTSYFTGSMKKIIIINIEDFMLIDFIETYTRDGVYIDSSLKSKNTKKWSPYVRYILFKHNNELFYGSCSTNNSSDYNFMPCIYNINDTKILYFLNNLNYYSALENKIEYIEGKDLISFDGITKKINLDYLYNCNNLNQRKYCIKIDNKVYYPLSCYTLIRIE